MLTLIGEPPQPRLHRGRVRPRAGRRLLRLFLRLTILLAGAALVAGGWYLARKGFSRSWRTRIVEELHKRGVEASIGRLTLDPFRGLVASNVRIFDYKKREQTLAVVNEISLDINYAALFHHQPFLNAVDIRDGDLSIPLPPAAGQVRRADLLQFRAHVYFPPERIEVSQAEGIFCGIRLSVTGQLIKRSNPQPSPKMSPEEANRRVRLLQSVVTILQGFRYPAGAPALELKFSGDLEHLEEARAEATLRASDVRRENYAARDLGLTMEWKDQTLTVPQLDFSDTTGRFSGTGAWNRATGRATFQARSTLDLPPLLGAFGFGAALDGLVLQNAPLIETSGSANFAGAPFQWEAIGKVALEKFAYRDVAFDGLTTDFAVDRTRTMLRDFRLRHHSGQLNADLFDAPNDFRLNLESSLAPGALATFAPPPIRHLLGEWEWQRSPSVRLNVRGSARDPATWNGEGAFAFGPTRFRGVRMNSASGDLHFGGGLYAVKNFQVARDEGNGTGGFSYDVHRREIRIDNVVTTLTPSEAINWIDPKFLRQVTPYRFHRTPHVVTNGIVQLAGGKQTHLTLDVSAPNGLDYTFIDKVLPFESISAQLLFTDDRLQILGLKGGLFAGSVAGGADISLGRKDPHYTATIAVDKMDFPSLTDLYFKYKTSQGELGGNFDFSGIGADRQALRGAGSIEVKNGNVFAIPVFGPLSELLSKIFTGAGYSVAHNAAAPFTIREGVIHTDKLKVAGKLFAMVGHGDLDFVKNNLDFDIRIDANGPGALLTPLYQLFEYHGSGSLTKPVWRPKHL